MILLTSVGPVPSEVNSQQLFDACLTKPARQSVLFDCLSRIMARPRRARDRTRSIKTPVAAQDHAGRAEAQERGRILVAEDNVINQQVAIGVLGALGYRSDVVVDGHGAVEASARVPYAAILMDCQMPEMDGYQAAQEIRRREGSGRHTPIIALTADVLKDARAKSLAAGMDDYIAKPLKPEELAAALNRWLQTAATPAEVTKKFDPKGAVDDAVLDGLRKLEQFGAPGLLKKLTGIFLEDTARRLTDLREAAQQGDLVGLRKLAHTLRGSAANMGAREVVRICGELEALGDDDIGIAASLIDDLEKNLDAVRDALLSNNVQGEQCAS